MEIPEPTKHTEFEIQAYLYTQLRLLGYNIRGEVNVRYKSSWKNRAKCRFDLADFSGGVLRGIIEVKSRPIKHKTEDGWLGTRQGSRYNDYFVPVRLILGMDDAINFVNTVITNKTLWGDG